MKKQKSYSLEIGKGLALLTQLAVSILTPLILFVFGAKYLSERLGIGQWMIPVAILLGISVGLMSAWNLVQAVLIQQKKQQARAGEEGADAEALLKEAKDRIASSQPKDEADEE